MFLKEVWKLHSDELINFDIPISDHYLVANQLCGVLKELSDISK